jgi:hypothetical protein
MKHTKKAYFPSIAKFKMEGQGVVIPLSAIRLYRKEVPLKGPRT